MRPPGRSVFPEIMQDYTSRLFKSHHTTGMIINIEKHREVLPSYDKQDGK
jgi:hypothetical protein